MLLRGHMMRDIYKGWTDHLAKFNEDRFTNYPRLRMWFRKMCSWAESALKAGVLCTKTIVSMDIPQSCASITPSISQRRCSAPDQSTPAIASPRRLATAFENEYVRIGNDTTPGNDVAIDEENMGSSDTIGGNIDMTDLIDAILPDSQGASQSFYQTTTLYQHLVIYKEFFATDDDLMSVIAILGTMKTRWREANRRSVPLNCECSNCGQMYINNASVKRHQDSNTSNCARTKRIHDLAISAIRDQQTRIQPRAPLPIDITEEITPPPNNGQCALMSSVFQDISRQTTVQHEMVRQRQNLPSRIIHRIGNIHISETCMATLTSEGQCVEDNIIDAFQNISQQLDWDSHYFHLNFFQNLVNVNGYDFQNVMDWTRDYQISNKKFIYFPIVFNGHYILIVAETGAKVIRCYDPLGTNRKTIMQFILRYLYDIFHMEDQDRDDTSTFDMESWSLLNVFTAATKIQFTSVDCGVFLMKFVHLLRQSIDVSSLSQNDVATYRRELATLIQDRST
jgi:hypothetical protein